MKLSRKDENIFMTLGKGILRAKNVNRHCPEEGILIAHKDRKSCENSLVIKEMQIKAIVGCH